MGMDPITLFLVDDHVMFREGLALLAGNESDFSVVGQCGGELDMVDQIREADPDVVVLDITMPYLNGLDICRELTRGASRPAVVMLTMHAEVDMVARALKYGAAGYLQKDSTPEQFIEAVRAAARGEVFIGKGIPRSVMERVGATDEDPYEQLSPRERQVLQLIAEGRTNRQIADFLGTALKTINNHRTALMSKLNIHEQASLVKFAVRKGLVQLTT